ncbi:S-layer homology domain-containing protein [Nodosilinea sp. E11]|uniref:S-layer homology domain-containing protein n=1 Tax=Nodosilinea sp. E11 TaxID=3037479 RepID=UPI0029346093|nr:S-layer homology domain-containing protein [Nodosilinea sp. E11]WOD38128.1 S-layer homology domain-containing protein [Nodosilinea sp. E11]
MPPLFRVSTQSKSRVKGSRKLPWHLLIPAWLLAIAAGGALVASSRQDPGSFIYPVASQPQGRGLRSLFNVRRQQSAPHPHRQPLTVPPPVVPQPLPPQQAWPDLPQVQTEARFIDLDPDHWAWPILADLAQRDLVAGFPDGTFRPADPMTRAEFATQIAQLFAGPQAFSSGTSATLYPDLSPSHWAYDSVQKSVHMGFLNGHPDGTFLPDQTISRIHVIVALANGLALKSSSGAAAVLAPYSDQKQVPPWAIHQAVAATEAGLVVNYPDLKVLNPNQPATRAEVATMLHRALVYTGKLQDVPLAYVVRQ